MLDRKKRRRHRERSKKRELHCALQCCHRKDRGVVLPRVLICRCEQQFCNNAKGKFVGKISFCAWLHNLRAYILVCAHVGKMQK